MPERAYAMISALISCQNVLLLALNLTRFKYELQRLQGLHTVASRSVVYGYSETVLFYVRNLVVVFPV